MCFLISMSSENTSEFQPSRKLLLANSFPYKLVPDDSMTILMAFRAPTVEIIGLTTIFGNTTTKNATQNALLLCERAGHPEVPVAEGSAEPLKVRWFTICLYSYM
jgi:hypothetical protein